MKRVYKRFQAPMRLDNFAKAFPQETWEHFRRRNRRGYREVKEQILRDQHGLCAYCEISIKLSVDEGSVDDFRVEHFFPKAETEADGHNYHLDWRNLLGVCHGGSQPYVVESEWRYSSKKNDRSCDVPKGGKPISERILNPLTIPAKRRIYKYISHTGKMVVDEKTCPPELVAKAKNTIRELNLNAPRLRRMRLTVIHVLEDELSNAFVSNSNIQDYLSFLAESLLKQDENGNYQPFFSVTRWFLGDIAENVLREQKFAI